ncbi:uncharacterized protein LOC111568696 [Amphiprion ocellaris]|uniref:uncharacterized protein LOC111568696 n=1 Tax=Amphiprion ocellaris TaxID=80972 RepID=UPI002410F468|nr:uncharacterized protein LOC111568696 [Amphiprion ocellaris]
MAIEPGYDKMGARPAVLFPFWLQCGLGVDPRLQFVYAGSRRVRETEPVCEACSSATDTSLMYQSMLSCCVSAEVHYS